jgi:hypothetical protein
MVPTNTLLHALQSIASAVEDLSIMKFALSLAWLSLVAGSTIRSPQPVSYNGYQVHRLRAVTSSQLASAKRALATIPHETLNHARGTWDVLIAPEQRDAFNALGLKSRTLHQDLAQSMSRESHVKKSWKRQSNGTEDVWFDSYHAYDDVSNLSFQPCAGTKLICDTCSTLDGGTNYRSPSPRTRTGPVLVPLTKAVTFSAFISGEQMVLASLPSSITAQCMPENGLLRWYVHTKIWLRSTTLTCV